MTSEDFDAWRDSNMTRWVMKAFRQIAEENKAAWIAASWDSGDADEISLREMRARADAYMAMAEMTFEDLQTTHGENDE